MEGIGEQGFDNCKKITMWRWHRRRIQKPVMEELQGKTFEFVSKKLDKIKSSVANRLSTYEQHMTTGQKKSFLFIFFICSSSVSMTLIYKGIFIQDRVSVFLQKDAVNMPQNSKLPDSLDVKWLEELQRINRARQALLDSLKK